MIKFDHLRIPVADLARSRAWYIRTLDLKVEFEVPDRQSVALQDTEGFTIFLQQVRAPIVPNQCGAELADPDGYVIRLWDEHSMKEKSGH